MRTYRQDITTKGQHSPGYLNYYVQDVLKENISARSKHLTDKTLQNIFKMLKNTIDVLSPSRVHTV